MNTAKRVLVALCGALLAAVLSGCPSVLGSWDGSTTGDETTSESESGSGSDGTDGGDGSSGDGTDGGSGSSDPAAVSSVQSSVAATTVELGWTDPSAEDLDHIDVTWSTDGGNTAAGSTKVSASVEEVEVSGLTEGTSYTFSLAAVDSDGNTSSTVNVSAVPATPYIFIANNGSDNEAHYPDQSDDHVTGPQDVGEDDNNSLTAAVGDIDGDGIPDVVVGEDSQSYRYNAKTGHGFTAAKVTESDSVAAHTHLGLGDLNGDALADIFGVPDSSADNQVFIATGQGGFEAPTGSDPRTNIENSDAVSLGDLNDDQILDAVVVGDSAPTRFYIGDGDGTFGDPAESSNSNQSRDVALAHLDGDDALDAFVANHSEANRVHLGDGGGGFSASNSAYPEGSTGENSNSVALADLNGDGHQDAFVANNGTNHLYVGEGDGTFQSPTDIDVGESRTSMDVAFGDFDGDGYLDAYVANSGETNSIYFGNGSAGFSERKDARSDGETNHSTAVVVANFAREIVTE